MLEEFFFAGVLVEPGDATQPPGDRSPRTASGFELAGEAFDVGAADGEEGQGAGAAPGGELAQIQRVRLSCQPAVSGQEPPASASRSASLNTGWMGTRVVVVVAVIGYLPVRAEAGRLGQARPQRNTRPPPSRRRARHVMSRCPIRRRQALRRDAFEIADSVSVAAELGRLWTARRMPGLERGSRSTAIRRKKRRMGGSGTRAVREN